MKLQIQCGIIENVVSMAAISRDRLISIGLILTSTLTLCVSYVYDKRCRP